MRRTPADKWLDVVTANGLAQGRAYEARQYGRCQDLADALTSAMEAATARHTYGSDPWCLAAVAAYEVSSVIYTA